MEPMRSDSLPYKQYETTQSPMICWAIRLLLYIQQHGLTKVRHWCHVEKSVSLILAEKTRLNENTSDFSLLLLLCVFRTWGDHGEPQLSFCIWSRNIMRPVSNKKTKKIKRDMGHGVHAWGGLEENSFVPAFWVPNALSHVVGLVGLVTTTLLGVTRRLEINKVNSSFKPNNLLFFS